MTFALLVAAALAVAPASAVEAPPPPTLVAMDAHAGRDPAEVIEEAIAVRRRGDPDAAHGLLLALEPMLPKPLRSAWLYQRGVCEEMAWRPDRAEALYRQVVADGGEAALDARFRLALVLEDQGRDAEALEEVLGLAKLRGLDERDQVTVDLQRGITEVRTGKARKGVRRIEATLASVEGGDSHRYMRAKARYTLAGALLAEAAEIPLEGGEKRVVKGLQGRAERILAAEKQIVAIAGLEEPEWIFAGLVDLGDSYARLAEALEAAPAPKKLTPEQAEIYRAEIARHAETMRTKAWHAWDQGVALATRIGWESPRVTTLEKRRASIPR